MEDYACRPAFPTPLQATKETMPSTEPTPTNDEQPVYEQLMPAAVVHAVTNSFELPIEVTTACGKVRTVLENTTNGTVQGHEHDACPSSVTATANLLEHSSQSQPLDEPQIFSNGQEKDCSTEVQLSHTTTDSAIEPSICNGVSLPVDENPRSTDLSIRDTSAVAIACISDPPDHVGDLLNDNPPSKEPVLDDLPESGEGKETNDIETSSYICDQTDTDNAPKEQAAKDDELQRRPQNVDTHEQNAPTIENETTHIAKDEEELDESHHDADENGSDTVISDEDSPKTDVASLFKNVVLVQADSIIGEDSEEPVSSPTGISATGRADEEQTDPIVTSSVEDIGREEEPGQDTTQLPAGLLIDETDDVQDYEMMESRRKTSNDVDTASPSSDEEASKGQSQKCQMRKRSINHVANEENGDEDDEKKKLRRTKNAETRNTNDDPFDSCSNSSSEDVPNDMYFGTSDRVYTVSTKLNWQRQKQKDRKQYSRAKGVRADQDDEEPSSDSEEEEERAQRRAKKAEEIARLKLPAYQQQQLHQMVLKKHPKRDRFYDRSQDIPNDIYFGNVNVPLHILHASSSSSSDEAPWPGGSVKSASNSSTYHAKSRKADYKSDHRCTKSNSAYSKSSSYRSYRTSSSRPETTSSQGGTRSVHRMKEYLKMAGFRHMRYQKLWQGCETNHDRAEAILRFLQEQGLQGEPTDEKCRELRKQIQLQKEVEVLDTSVIISAGEGRVTRQRAKKVSESSTTEAAVNSVADQILQNKEDIKAAPTSTETVEQNVQPEQLSSEEKEHATKNDAQVEEGPTEQPTERTSPDGECSNNSEQPLNA